MDIKDEDFRNLFNQMPDPAFFHDAEFRLILANPAYYKAAGVSPEEATGQLYWKIFPKGEGALAGCQHAFSTVSNDGSREEVVVDNKTFISFSYIDRNAEGVAIHAMHIMSDVTKEKVSERLLNKISAQYDILFALSPDAIMLMNDQTFTDCNPAALKIFGCDSRSDFVGKGPIDFSPVVQPNGIASSVLAKEKIVSAFKNGSSRFTWMHCRLDGTISPAEVLLVAFVREGTRILQATVTDITARVNKEIALEKALTGIVSTLSKTMELRDPYTAGHQSRVAAIASLIAKELGWDENKIKGLHMAGLVHDIGKIAIPSEILTKPSKLSEFEEMLLKKHPEHSYALLKDIEFPWPIADFVRQHHERMDGSGYPLGLKAEEISPEARVLAVADTIEAMSTHRPYRPALGLTAALAVLKAGSGVKFDANIVDTALRLCEGKESLEKLLS